MHYKYTLCLLAWGYFNRFMFGLLYRAYEDKTIIFFSKQMNLKTLEGLVVRLHLIKIFY